jgi:DNA-binding LacI/PurR family transcriptional regulator
MDAARGFPARRKEWLRQATRAIRPLRAFRGDAIRASNWHHHRARLRMAITNKNRPPKMSDIAKLAGVHTSTVSRALAGSPLVEKGMRDKILRIARSNGYTVNSTARSLRLQRTQSISVVFPLGHEVAQPLTDPFFVQMIGHLADKITQRGYGLFLRKIVPPMEDWLTNLIASKRSDGIIVIGQSTEHEALEAVAGGYLPLVVWGGQIERQSYCTVGSDNVAGARLATEHLLSLGRRHIVFLGDTKVPELRLRYKGYCHAIAGAPRGTAPKRNIPTHMTADQAFDAMTAVLAKGDKFDGVVCATDVIAMSAIRAIAAAGKRVPQDISVVGYDDLALAAHTNPSLTTVRQNIETGARHMIDLLFRRMDGEPTESITMAPELIIRESSGGLSRK